MFWLFKYISCSIETCTKGLIGCMPCFFWLIRFQSSLFISKRLCGSSALYVCPNSKYQRLCLSQVDRLQSQSLKLVFRPSFIFFLRKKEINHLQVCIYLFIYLFQLRLGMPCEESCSDLLFEEAQKEMMTSTTQPPGPHSLHAYCHHQCCINGDHRQRLSLWGVI